MSDITQEFLRHLFNYDPETGLLTNRIYRSSKAPLGAEAGTVWTGAGGKSYRSVNLNGRLFSVHRLIWIYVQGDCPEQIDHIDGNGLNNKFTNLRSVTHSENQKNLRMPINNKSKHVGVMWNKRQNRWQATINCENKRFYLGLFLKIDDAIAARQAAQTKLGFHPNHGLQRNKAAATNTESAP